MARELGAPQERGAVGDLLLRAAAVPLERDGVAIEPRRFRPVAGIDLEQREMPGEMAMEEAVAWIGGEPLREVAPRLLAPAALVADMGEAVRAVRVVRIRRHRLLDLRPRAVELPVLGERHGVI